MGSVAEMNPHLASALAIARQTLAHGGVAAPPNILPHALGHVQMLGAGIKRAIPMGFRPHFDDGGAAGGDGGGDNGGDGADGSGGYSGGSYGPSNYGGSYGRDSYNGGSYGGSYGAADGSDPNGGGLDGYSSEHALTVHAAPDASIGSMMDSPHNWAGFSDGSTPTPSRDAYAAGMTGDGPSMSMPGGFAATPSATTNPFNGDGSTPTTAPGYASGADIMGRQFNWSPATPQVGLGGLSTAYDSSPLQSMPQSTWGQNLGPPAEDTVGPYRLGSFMDNVIGVGPAISPTRDSMVQLRPDNAPGPANLSQAFGFGSFGHAKTGLARGGAIRRHFDDGGDAGGGDNGGGDNSGSDSSAGYGGGWGNFGIGAGGGLGAGGFGSVGAGLGGDSYSGSQSFSSSTPAGEDAYGGGESNYGTGSYHDNSYSAPSNTISRADASMAANDGPTGYTGSGGYRTSDGSGSIGPSGIATGAGSGYGAPHADSVAGFGNMPADHSIGEAGFSSNAGDSGLQSGIANGYGDSEGGALMSGMGYGSFSPDQSGTGMIGTTQGGPFASATGYTPSEFGNLGQVGYGTFGQRVSAPGSFASGLGLRAATQDSSSTDPASVDGDRALTVHGYGSLDTHAFDGSIGPVGIDHQFGAFGIDGGAAVDGGVAQLHDLAGNPIMGLTRDYSGTIGPSGQSTASVPGFDNFNAGQSLTNSLGNVDYASGASLPGQVGAYNPDGWSADQSRRVIAENPGDYTQIGQFPSLDKYTGFNGFTPNFARGYLGNDQAEAGPGLPTDAINQTGFDTGLSQWTGPRKAAMLESLGIDPHAPQSVIKSELTPDTLTSQMLFGLNEIATQRQYAKVLANAQNPNLGPEQQAYQIARTYEAPKSITDDPMSVAARNELARREAFARAYAPGTSVTGIGDLGGQTMGSPGLAPSIGPSLATPSAPSIDGTGTGFNLSSYAPGHLGVVGQSLSRSLPGFSNFGSGDGLQSSMTGENSYAPGSYGPISALNPGGDPTMSPQGVTFGPGSKEYGYGFSSFSPGLAGSGLAGTATNNYDQQAPGASYTNASDPRDYGIGGPYGTVPDTSVVKYAPDTSLPATAPTIQPNVATTDGAPALTIHPVSPGGVDTSPAPYGGWARVLPATPTPGDKNLNGVASKLINAGVSVVNPIAGMINGISTLVGGPNVGGLVTKYSTPGAPATVMGTENSSVGRDQAVSGYGGANGYQAQPTGSQANAGSSPAVTAQKAYLDALKNLPGPSTGYWKATAVPLVAPGVGTANVYNPMTDPVVMRALAMAKQSSGRG